MKTKTIKMLAVVIAVSMMLTASLACAGENWSGKEGKTDKEGHFKKMAEQLQLTPEQKAALEKQREETRPKKEALREKQRAAREELKAELDKATPDKAKLNAIVENLKNFTGEQLQMMIDKVTAMKTVLTPEQSAKMKSIMEEKKKEFKAKHGDKDKDDVGPHHDDM